MINEQFNRIIVLCLFVLFQGGFETQAQNIRFNEVVTSNTIHLDEDGDTPDWFELHNIGLTTIELGAWTVTDNPSEPDKWTFPNISLSPDAYLQIWASGKDRLDIGLARTLITQGDEFKYISPTQPISQWKTQGYNDDAWNEGPSGFGYGDGDDETVLPVGTQTVFLRKKFNVADASLIQELILDVDYDDGFVAYINGVEIARANLNGGTVDYNALAITDHEAMMYNNGIPDRFPINNLAGLLQNGENILAIQVHNVGATSSDLTMIPFLSAVYSSPSSEGITPPAILGFGTGLLHTNFKISSEGETLYLYDATGDLIDEIAATGMATDISKGFLLGGADLRYFEETTPGEANPVDGFLGINAANIVFSHPGGVVTPMTLTLSGIEAPAIIRYTIDATVPDATDQVYSGPIFLNQKTVVRARVFSPSYIPSKIQTHTYLVDVSHDLPVISFVMEPEDLFDSENGMYVLGDGYQGDIPYFGSNIWEEWERPVHFSFFESDGSLGFAFDGGAKIFGGWSRANDQRSFSVFARNAYGTDEIVYPLFPDLNYFKFQSIILRTSGTDWLNTMMRDVTLTGLMEGADLEFQANRPTVTYINGDYWGIYNVREKISEHFLASKFNIATDQIDLLETDGVSVHGDNTEYIQLKNFILGNSLVSDANFAIVEEQIDIDNFILYYLSQIYFDNQDWPGNNIKFWKHDGGKWRWILYDTDFGFGIWNDNAAYNNTLDFALEPNGPGWPNPPWSTLFFRKLMENVNFRNQFVNRYADELNTRFLPERVVAKINENAARIQSEIPDHYDRWSGFLTYWYTKVDGMRSFANQRPQAAKSHIRNQFGLNAFHRVFTKVEDQSHGYLTLNSLTIDEATWSGDYFEGVPIKITAIPKEGYEFLHWTGTSNATTDEIVVDITNTSTFEPVFIEIGTADKQIIINEINYESGEDRPTDDWIELHNIGQEVADISNWRLKNMDDLFGFIFPEGTSIPGGGYLLVAKNLSQFQSVYPEIENVLGDFNFDLSNISDGVILMEEDGEVWDEVYYSSDGTWPSEANGQGGTLELREPSLDNSNAWNWDNVHQYGSPGATNILIIPPYIGDPITDILFSPNPFSQQGYINFCVKQKTKVEAKLYDIKGVVVKEVLNQEYDRGIYEVKVDFSSLANGVYFIRFIAEDEEPIIEKWVRQE